MQEPTEKNPLSTTIIEQHNNHPITSCTHQENLTYATPLATEEKGAIQALAPP